MLSPNKKCIFKFNTLTFILFTIFIMPVITLFDLAHIFFFARLSWWRKQYSDLLFDRNSLIFVTALKWVPVTTFKQSHQIFSQNVNAKPYLLTLFIHLVVVVTSNCYRRFWHSISVLISLPGSKRQLVVHHHSAGHSLGNTDLYNKLPHIVTSKAGLSWYRDI